MKIRLSLKLKIQPIQEKMRLVLIHLQEAMLAEKQKLQHKNL